MIGGRRLPGLELRKLGLRHAAGRQAHDPIARFLAGAVTDGWRLWFSHLAYRDVADARTGFYAKDARSGSS
jgi:hypothetical protein